MRIDYAIFGFVSLWRASGPTSFHAGANIRSCFFYWCISSVVFPFECHRDLPHFIYVFVYLSSKTLTRWCPQWCRVSECCKLLHSYTLVPAVVLLVGVSRFHVPFQQHSYTLVPTVVLHVRMSRFQARFLHAGAHSGVACRIASNDILSSNIPTRWCP